VRGKRANRDGGACPALRWRSVSHHTLGSSKQWSMRLVQVLSLTSAASRGLRAPSVLPRGRD
jgi:hypothetical protein